MLKNQPRQSLHLGARQRQGLILPPVTSAPVFVQSVQLGQLIDQILFFLFSWKQFEGEVAELWNRPAVPSTPLIPAGPRRQRQAGL